MRVRRAVAVYVDRIRQRSDAAFDRYVEENMRYVSGWQHVLSTGGDLLDSLPAGAIAAAHISSCR
jgi:hypothetical protein